MEEQNNQNFEAQESEVIVKETFIAKVKKFFSEKTNLIASIVAAVVIIATIVCIIAFGKPAADKAIIGEWYNPDFDITVRFSDDKTGEFDMGMIIDFEWEYDEENDNYRANISGYRMTFTFITEEGLTFLENNAFGYFFKEEESEAALAKADALRDNIIDNALKDKKMITTDETIFEGDCSVVLNSVQMNEFVPNMDGTVTCNITITANRDITSDELNSLIKYIRYYYVDMNFMPSSSKNNYAFHLSDAGLAKDDTLNTSFELRFSNNDFKNTVQKWGLFHGYAIFTIGETEYRLDLREYTKQ